MIWFKQIMFEISCYISTDDKSQNIIHSEWERQCVVYIRPKIFHVLQ